MDIGAVRPVMAGGRSGWTLTNRGMVMTQRMLASDSSELPLASSSAAHGERLRVAIQQRGMGKLSVVACAVGVTESAVSRWRSGGAMTLGNVVTICQTLDISADWFVLGRGHMDMHMSGSVRGFPHIARHIAKLSPRARQQLNHFLAALVDP